MLHNERILGMSFPQEKPNTEAPEEFENATLLLRQGLPLTTNPWNWKKKRRFSKTLSKPEEFENASLCVLVWTENILQTEVFENADYVISLQ